ncbi:MAG: hypothetical protein WD826_03660 [Actinomycetota bacterium]
MDEPLTKDEVFDLLTDLWRLERPVWLAGGLAADFYAEAWTRDHHDIDLVAFDGDREALEDELVQMGFTMTADEQWITRWTRKGRDIGEVSLAYMHRSGPDTGDLVITEQGSRGRTIIPGRYPGVPGNLNAGRVRVLEGVRFRVVSAEDEWVYTHSFSTMRPGAEPGLTDEHNLKLLESVLTEEDIERLRPLVGRHLPLEEVDAES